MICEEETNELKKVLGNRFAKDVQKILLQNGIYVKGAETYSDRYISHVLNGRYENASIEGAIYTLYEERKAAQELLANRKNRLLNKKPVSGNSQA